MKKTLTALALALFAAGMLACGGDADHNANNMNKPMNANNMNKPAMPASNTNEMHSNSNMSNSNMSNSNMSNSNMSNSNMSNSNK